MAATSQYLSEDLLAYMFQDPATPIAKPYDQKPQLH